MCKIFKNCGAISENCGAISENCGAILKIVVPHFFLT